MTAPDTNPICSRSRCNTPVGRRRIVLINPDGTDGKTCGPYCEPHTGLALANLMPTYTGGGPAYRVDKEGL